MSQGNKRKLPFLCSKCWNSSMARKKYCYNYHACYMCLNKLKVVGFLSSPVHLIHGSFSLQGISHSLRKSYLHSKIQKVHMNHQSPHQISCCTQRFLCFPCDMLWKSINFFRTISLLAFCQFL